VDAKRDSFGRPLIIPPDGGKPVAYRRCTTFIDVLSDRSALERWKQRKTAIGLAARKDLLLRVATSKHDNKALDQVCEWALKASGSDSSANIGTAIHSLTEAIDRGNTPEIPEDFAKDIQAYLAATKPFFMEQIEVFVVNDDLRVGGTFDRVVSRPEGIRMVADLKTGSVHFDAGKIAMQLAVYANSQVYDVATGERSKLSVNTEVGLVFHLPQGEGKCSVLQADLVAGWQGAQLAADVWAWRAKKGFLT
jgi:hypothetical protein